MAKQDIVAGLDIGSAQVACVIGRRDPFTGQVEILSGSRTACLGGLKGGVVINIDETARAITRICEEAEDVAKEMVKELTISIRGAHLQTFNNHGALNIARTDKEITPDDVEKAIENAQAVHMSQDREIIHTIPQGFTLDRQQGVPNPVGMEGSLLEVDVHIVTASRSHLNNIFKAINSAGFTVTEPIYGLLAAGEIVVTQEEKDLGCVMLDIGGQTTDLAVYFDGSVHYTEKLPLGSDAITSIHRGEIYFGFTCVQQTGERQAVVFFNLLCLR
jgi:cell division protein FtsA